MPTTEATPCSPWPKAGEYDKIRKLAYDTFGLDLRTGKETLVSTGWPNRSGNPGTLPLTRTTSMWWRTPPVRL